MSATKNIGMLDETNYMDQGDYILPTNQKIRRDMNVKAVVKRVTHRKVSYIVLLDAGNYTMVIQELWYLLYAMYVEPRA